MNIVHETKSDSMQENDFFQTMMTSIEQLVDERINLKIRELQKEMDAKDTIVNSNNDGEYLSIDDLSKLTGLQKATIYAKRSRRELPAYKFGRELRFKRSEVDAWIRSKQLTCLHPITSI